MVNYVTLMDVNCKGGATVTTWIKAKLSNGFKIMAVVALVPTILIGCKSEQAVVHQENYQPVKPQQAVISPANNQSVTQTSRENGAIVSKDLVQVPGQNPNINIYKIFYMSEGTKVEAFLSEPKKSGKYPLHVTLHGGWSYERPSITNEKSNGWQAENFKNAPDNVVRIAPQYRGYMDSDGSVQGLAGNTLDTQNAIKAAMSWENVIPDSIYLTGASMGGGVALRTASERQDVKAVVAVSPFVGWDTIIHWMDNNPNEGPINVQELRKRANVYKETFSKNPGKEKENSLLDRIPDIQAPVLLLQGTGDDLVVWQTVQEFAARMKERNKTVKLILYPDGAHGLKDQYQKETSKEMASWFTEYGLSQVSGNPQ
jgi:dipeptidyl aminopeptidase/acylaminoacyl peptidase